MVTAMIALQQILVAHDFSPCSTQALNVGIDLALRTGARLHVLYAEVLHEDAFSPTILPADHTKRVLEHMQEVTAEGTAALEPGQLKIEQAVERDVAAAPAILRYAAEHDVDLILMGTHGRRGLRRLFLGSVAEEVVRLSTCPVLTVRATQPDAETEVEARTDVKTLLVPVDFSRHSREALRQAKRIAAAYGASITLAHVIEEPLHPAFYNTGVVSIYDVQPDLESRAREQLQVFYETADGPEVPVRYQLLTGHAATAVVDYARTAEADLIVMATHGLAGVAHFVLGSVAEKVVRQAPCPVLTMKAQGNRLFADAEPAVAAPARAERTPRPAAASVVTPTPTPRAS